tara:strand:+ start:569 stop:1072 length:504 start_codon:yes stop_codon:yes gene_type:complete
MAVTQGISKISGVGIANVAKEAGVAKANIWSIAGEQRQASLFRSLINSGWASYSQGKNSASFQAVGSSSGKGYVYFANANHTIGQTYNFNFAKDATDAGKVWTLAVSSNATFDAVGELNGGALTSSAGAVNVSLVATNVPTGTAYIGINKSDDTSTDSITVTDLIVI